MNAYNNIKAEIGDIIIMIGENFDLVLDIYSKDDNGVLTAYDLGSKTVRMEVRATKTGAVLLTMVSPTNITISGDDNERITFSKTITELGEGTNYYDLQVDEDDYTIRAGRMIAKAQITDD